MKLDQDTNQHDSKRRPSPRNTPAHRTPREIDEKRVFGDVMQGLFGIVAPPITISRFQIIERIGRGAMGEVHSAYDPVLKRRVALKMLGEDFTKFPEENRADLLREAQALAQLSHANVIQVYEVGIDEQPVFIAMELIDGQNLKQWLYQSNRSWKEIVTVLREAGQGLAAAHDVGIVHRDFKPDNVLIESKTGRICVADFGLAHPVLPHFARQDDDSQSKIDGNSRIHSRRYFGGTPVFMSPEQKLGIPHLKVTSTVFARHSTGRCSMHIPTPSRTMAGSMWTQPKDLLLREISMASLTVSSEQSIED